MTEPPSIRIATCDDAAALRDIYAPYVLNTAITSEVDVPTVEEFAGRISTTLGRHPWLVAERDGVPVGYAYASPSKGRAGYNWSVEMSIYVDQNERRGGIGGTLYRCLEKVLAKQGVVDAYAWVCYPAIEDEYCTFDSFNFHKHMGYEPICSIPNAINKFGKWYGLAILRKELGPHVENPDPFSPLPELAARFTANAAHSNAAYENDATTTSQVG